MKQSTALLIDHASQPDFSGFAIIYRTQDGLHYGRVVRTHAGFYEVRTVNRSFAVLPSEVVSTFDR